MQALNEHTHKRTQKFFYVKIESQVWDEKLS